jgi:hypothetical protein
MRLDFCLDNMEKSDHLGKKWARLEDRINPYPANVENRAS